MLAALGFFGCTPRAPQPAARSAPAEAVDRTSHRADPCASAHSSLLKSFHGRVAIVAYLSDGTPKRAAVATRLRAMLQEYQAASDGKLDVSFPVSVGDDARRAANALDLREAPFEDDDASTKSGFMGLVFTYGSATERMPWVPFDAIDQLDFALMSRLRNLRDRAEGHVRRFGTLVGHGEIGLNEPNLVPASEGKPTMRQIVSQNFPFIAFSDVDVQHGARAIDASLDALLITQPTEDLSDAELRRIDDYVLLGRPLLVFASAVNVTAGDPSMQAKLHTHGLEKLLAGYGITMERNIVLDFGRSTKLEISTAQGPASARFPDILAIRSDARFTGVETLLDVTFPAFYLAPEIAFPFASSLTIHPDVQPSAVLDVIARSTPRSTASAEEPLDLTPVHRWKIPTTWSQYAVAATASGTMRTAFPAPGGSPRLSATPAHVLVMASSQLLANPFVRATDASDSFGLGDFALAYAKSSMATATLIAVRSLEWAALDEPEHACIDGARH